MSRIGWLMSLSCLATLSACVAPDHGPEDQRADAGEVSEPIGEGHASARAREGSGGGAPQPTPSAGGSGAAPGDSCSPPVQFPPPPVDVEEECWFRYLACTFSGAGDVPCTALLSCRDSLPSCEEKWPPPPPGVSESQWWQYLACTQLPSDMVDGNCMDLLQLGCGEPAPATEPDLPPPPVGVSDECWRHYLSCVTEPGADAGLCTNLLSCDEAAPNDNLPPPPVGVSEACWLEYLACGQGGGDACFQVLQACAGE